MDTFNYFAYGSNLLKERLILSNPSAKFVGIGKLEGYMLTFDTPEYLQNNNEWEGAVATIREGQPADSRNPSQVWGVVWELDMKDMETLDRQETGYKRFNVTLKMDSGTMLPCYTYEIDVPTTGDTVPNPFYLDILKAGAKQNRMPEEYIQFLGEIRHNGRTQAPPMYLEVMEQIQRNMT